MALIVDLFPEVQLEVVVVAFTEELEEPENEDQILLQLIRYLQIIILKLNLLLPIPTILTLLIPITLFLNILMSLFGTDLINNLIIHHLILKLHILLNISKILLDHLLDLNKKVVESILLKMLQKRRLSSLIATQQQSHTQVQAL